MAAPKHPISATVVSSTKTRGSKNDDSYKLHCHQTQPQSWDSRIWGSDEMRSCHANIGASSGRCGEGPPLAGGRPGILSGCLWGFKVRALALPRLAVVSVEFFVWRSYPCTALWKWCCVGVQAVRVVVPKELPVPEFDIDDQLEALNQGKPRSFEPPVRLPDFGSSQILASLPEALLQIHGDFNEVSLCACCTLLVRDSDIIPRKEASTPALPGT